MTRIEATQFICAKCGELDRAFVVLEQMASANATPDTITFTALIAACARTQQTDRAFELLGQVPTAPRRKGRRPLPAACYVSAACGMPAACLRLLTGPHSMWHP